MKFAVRRANPEAIPPSQPGSGMGMITPMNMGGSPFKSPMSRIQFPEPNSAAIGGGDNSMEVSELDKLVLHDQVSPTPSNGPAAPFQMQPLPQKTIHK